MLDHRSSICRRKSLVNGFITGSAIRCPICVRFQCSLHVSTFEMAKKPCVVLGRSVSLGRLDGVGKSPAAPKNNIQAHPNSNVHKRATTKAPCNQVRTGIVRRFKRFDVVLKVYSDRPAYARSAAGTSKNEPDCELAAFTNGKDYPKPAVYQLAWNCSDIGRTERLHKNTAGRGCGGRIRSQRRNEGFDLVPLAWEDEIGNKAFRALEDRRCGA